MPKACMGERWAASRLMDSRTPWFPLWQAASYAADSGHDYDSDYDLPCFTSASVSLSSRFSSHVIAKLLGL